MLCIPIIGPTLAKIESQVAQGCCRGDLLELRIDLFDDIDLKALKRLREAIAVPVIITLRKVDQGGRYRGSEEMRLRDIEQLADLLPEYLDLEYDVPPAFIDQIRREFPSIQLILSYHNFSLMPDDLEGVLHRMQRVARAIYKIACMAQSTNDALRMLLFVKEHPSVFGMAMGEVGQVSRILGPIVGNPWGFATVNEEGSAPGQLSYEDLSQIYTVRRLNQKSAIYGLIGGSVALSLSDRTHNAVMRELEVNAVYVKMALRASELEEFFFLAKKIGFQGLSVTMPLKEAILPFLDEIEESAAEIGAVNTLVFREDKLIGYNTDGKGALDAIEERFLVAGKRVMVLGAGGAAKAIIYEAIKRGAYVTVLNRNLKRAEELAQKWPLKAATLESIAEEFQRGYDVLINATPDALPIDPCWIDPKSLVMESKTQPKMTSLLNHAEQLGCDLVFGYEMFVNQAVRQFELWFPGIGPSKVRKILLCEALKRL